MICDVTMASGIATPTLPADKDKLERLSNEQQKKKEKTNKISIS